MTFLQLVTLAFVQGITEFLPISSSGHLILVAKLSNWSDQGLNFDIAAHLGSLLAVCVYFRKDIGMLLCAWFPNQAGNERGNYKRLSIYLIIATLPIVIFGLVFYDFIMTQLRSVYLIGVMTIAFGLVLWMADALGSKSRCLDNMSWRDAILIGCIQAIALIPGTSRSGVTVSTALLLGFSRDHAVKFSFLLGIPTILAAVIYEIFAGGSVLNEESWYALGTMTILSAGFAYASIYYFIRVLGYIGMLPFALYRVVLGTSLILFAANPTITTARDGLKSLPDMETVVFAGGCFWCLEEPFDELRGVYSTMAGYTGGTKHNATYSEVSKGYSRHVEAVKVTYNSREVSFAQLLEVYWRNIDPLDSGGQFCDRGRQYLGVVFFSNSREENEVKRQLEELQKSRFPNNRIVTAVRPAKPFYPAESYHQDYYLTNPFRYKLYRYQCGRDTRLHEVWERE